MKFSRFINESANIPNFSEDQISFLENSFEKRLGIQGKTTIEIEGKPYTRTHGKEGYEVTVNWENIGAPSSRNHGKGRIAFDCVVRGSKIEDIRILDATGFRGIQIDQNAFESIVMEADVFADIDVIKLDPDRADSHDVVNALMPTLIRMAYVYLVDDKAKYERTHRDEEDTPFEFTTDELDDRLENLIENVVKRFEEVSMRDRKADIKKMSSEFKEKLNESVMESKSLSRQVAINLGVDYANDSSLTELTKYLKSEFGLQSSDVMYKVAIDSYNKERKDIHVK